MNVVISTQIICRIRNYVCDYKFPQSLGNARGLPVRRNDMCNAIHAYVMPVNSFIVSNAFDQFQHT